MPQRNAPERWLVRAHAGELGAALAYRGHARSLRPGPERDRVLAILREELAHRHAAAAWLRVRGALPDRRLMRRIARIGRMAGIACRFTGHVLPMLGAAVAEVVNVWEYQAMAQTAEGDLRTFAHEAARTERDHACWFVACAARHGACWAWIGGWLLRCLPARREPQPCLSTKRAVLVTGST